MESVAPVVLFVYNRLEHTRRTVSALARNLLAADTDLIIYSDASSSESAEEEVAAVRKYINGISGFASVTIICRERNWGLANSIVDGVTSVVNECGRVIVLEDDIVTSPFFLMYMNEALERYADNNEVMHVAGYAPEMPLGDLKETFFLRQTSCWGWATWKRAWSFFSKDSELFIKAFTSADITSFNLNGSYDYWSQLLENHRGQRHTWAVFWYASVFLQEGLCLHPRASLVFNIGFDGTGTNCGAIETIQREFEWTRKISEFPAELKVCPVATMYFENTFSSAGERSAFSRLMWKFLKLVQRF
ncbi:sugar transferase [Oleidesulfovibrio alaskensis G20]|uniref:Sugar transferase n=1 Tax=Oleidesulfovibrio alaskensis (strain ATCC BAA-1058 / DSM 17464 / G20) TaxID=207559 RepID=Q30XB8_OLEA2|nr:glycosyltransferase [Oleidesulfovibrio alaskensis]ABB39678.1 sugar transferase [Oleidesulfovibrio alaskensis G20]